MPMLPELESLLNPLLQIARTAGAAIATIYHQQQPIHIATKPDHTPVTEADFMAHQLIAKELLRLTPALPLLSEEGKAITFAERQSWQHYWLIDPLDGTQEFINGSPDFTINIALIAKHRPILGLIYQPMTQLTYYAIRGQGAFKLLMDRAILPIQVRSKPGQPMIAISRRHNPLKLRALLGEQTHYEVLTMGSALKICAVAEGLADIYPRMGPTSEWDTAAGQCILEEAGGQLIDLQGNALMYNTKNSLLNPGFLAIGDNRYDWLSYLTINR